MLIFLSTIPTVHALTVPPPKQKRNKSNSAHKHPIVRDHKPVPPYAWLRYTPIQQQLQQRH